MKRNTRSSRYSISKADRRRVSACHLTPLARGHPTDAGDLLAPFPRILQCRAVFLPFRWLASSCVLHSSNSKFFTAAFNSALSRRVAGLRQSSREVAMRAVLTPHWNSPALCASAGSQIDTGRPQPLFVSTPANCVRV
jgi:hypothetical protein